MIFHVKCVQLSIVKETERFQTELSTHAFLTRRSKEHVPLYTINWWGVVSSHSCLQLYLVKTSQKHHQHPRTFCTQTLTCMVMWRTFLCSAGKGVFCPSGVAVGAGVSVSGRKFVCYVREQWQNNTSCARRPWACTTNQDQHALDYFVTRLHAA